MTAVAAEQLVALDLFAGHGWGVALRRLGIIEHAVEISESAIATRVANGLSEPIYRDVWEGLDDPSLVPAHDIEVNSPPCPTFSSAGKGDGRRAMPALLAAIDDRRYESVESLRALAEETDPESALVLIPLAYAFQHRPRFMVLEQVREVLPIWRKYAEVLRSWGYSVWVGILNAEQYGVPQTRRRAILIARRDGLRAEPPPPTHSRYYERASQRLDPGVERWVSMEDALGWNVDRPAPTVTGGGLALAGPSRSGAEVAPRFGRRLALVSNYGSGGDPSNRGIRRADEPAPTITSKAGRNMVRVETGQNSAQAGGTTKRYSREVDRPAPTVTGQTRSWRVRTSMGTPKVDGRNGTHELDPANRPAHTVTGKSGEWIRWIEGDDAINLTPEEAAILQSYPADFVLDVMVPDPKRGGLKPITKGDIFQGIGNAVPPLLAEAILRTLLTTPEPDAWADVFEVPE